MTPLPFEPRHLAPFMAPENLDYVAAHWRARGPAITLLEKGRVLGCAGAVIEGRRAHLWAALTEELRARPALLYRTAHRFIDQVEADHRPEALEATAHREFLKARNWLRHLGFQPQGEETMGGEPYVRYVKWL